MLVRENRRVVQVYLRWVAAVCRRIGGVAFEMFIAVPGFKLTSFF